jgi:hypothetical protein
MKKVFAVCVFALFAAIAVADHLPAALQARGKPETILAGIDLAHGDADEVLQKFGPPTKKVTVPNNPQWTGYLWDTSTTRLEVEVSRGKDKNYLNAVTIVRLGDGARNAADATGDSTGQGLRLGDNLGQLKKIYGSRFKLSKQTPKAADTPPFLDVPGVQTVMVQWTSLEFTLMAGLDAQGHIVALRLRPPECYPGGCE